MSKHIDEADAVHPGQEPHRPGLPRQRGPRRARSANLASALIVLLKAIDEAASFMAEFCERGGVMARQLRGAARAAASTGGLRSEPPARIRRAPVRGPAASVVPFSELDRQRARNALARANLHTVKRSP